jgi:hypothetical protein
MKNSVGKVDSLFFTISVLNFQFESGYVALEFSFLWSFYLKFSAELTEK